MLLCIYMNDASGKHFFDVGKKVGEASYLSIYGLENYVTHHHEADFIKSANDFLETIGGCVTGEDVFHINHEEIFNPEQFEI